MRRKVILHDVTLREGIEAAVRPIDSGIKVRLAGLIANAGISELQVGYIGRNESDRDAMREIRASGVTAALEGICSVAATSWSDEVESALKDPPDRLNLILPSSDSRLAQSGLTRRQMIDRSAEAVRSVAGRCPVSFTPVDATRTEVSLLLEVLDAVTDAGADRFYVIDTAGVSSPARMGVLAGAIVSQSRIPIATHCHDDLGMATANGLMAVEAGVSVVDVCVNGMGKRAGNLALEEIAVALRYFHGIETGIFHDQLFELSHQVAQITGVPVHTHKALVGLQAFDTRVDKSLRGSVGHDAAGVLDPTLVGHPGVPPQQAA